MVHVHAVQATLIIYSHSMPICTCRCMLLGVKIEQSIIAGSSGGQGEHSNTFSTHTHTHTHTHTCVYTVRKFQGGKVTYEMAKQEINLCMCDEKA